ncbi:MAG: hypothetical protein AAGJ85_03315 [Pseudomonadota bacterium]
MNALFANLIWATPELFVSERVFESRVEALLAETVANIDLLNDSVQLAHEFETEIASVTSSTARSIFAEEQFVSIVNDVALPDPVANDYAPEFDVIGPNRGLLHSDFEEFIATLAPEKIATEASDLPVDVATSEFQGIEPCALTDEMLTEARLVDTSELIDVTVNWTNTDASTGFVTASIDDIG